MLHVLLSICILACICKLHVEVVYTVVVHFRDLMLCFNDVLVRLRVILFIYLILIFFLLFL